MNKETLIKTLLEANCPPNQIEWIINKVEEEDLYYELKDLESRPKGIRLGYAYSKIKTHSYVQEKRKYIVKHIKNKMMPHIMTILNASNKPLDSSDTYEFPCGIKAFCIEYMLKSIEILSNIEGVYRNNNASIESLVDDFLKKSKGRLSKEDTSKHYTGHEINDLFNLLIPDHIKTLIKYKTITNSVDPNVAENGEIIKPVNDNKSMENFIADYYLSIKDFNIYEEAAKQAQGLEKNNSIFVKGRYLNQSAEMSDYKLLNCMMIATYMALEYLLEHPEIAKKFSKDEIIPYRALNGGLTKEEYEHLVSLGDHNKDYDTNSLITYHTFLKQYLKDRTPELNDDRYARINNLFNQIKATNDISTTSEIFGNWFKNIDIKSLSKEEYKELKIIAPEFIYNSLSYEDKLIFKKCQNAGIEFEYYYRFDPERFEQIVNTYGKLFKENSIDIRLLTQKTSDAELFLNTLKEINLNIDELPSYYYDYKGPELRQGYITKYYNKKSIQRLLLTEDELREAKIEYQTQELLNMATENTRAWGCPTASFRERARKYAEKNQASDQKRKERLLALSEKIKSGELPSQENENESNKNIFTNVESMMQIANECGIDTIEPLIGMDEKEIHEKKHKLKTKEKYLGFASKIESFMNEFIRKHGVEQCQKILFSFFLIGSCPKIQAMMDKGIEVKPNMRFLTPFETSKSYSDIIHERPDLEIGDYLLYKTPEETEKILEICKEKNTKFEPELLYFDIDICKKNFSTLIAMINLVKRTKGTPFSYEDAAEVLKTLEHIPSEYQANNQNGRYDEINGAKNQKYTQENETSRDIDSFNTGNQSKICIASGRNVEKQAEYNKSPISEMKNIENKNEIAEMFNNSEKGSHTREVHSIKNKAA